MKTYTFTYTTIITGEITVTIEDGTPMPELEAYRQARASQPFLRTAQLELVRDERKEGDDATHHVNSAPTH